MKQLTIQFVYKAREISLSLHDNTDELTKQILADKTFCQLFRKEKEYASIKTGQTVIDCGANIGNDSILMALFNAKVHAFEPVKETFDLLIRNSLYNKLDIRCYPFVVSDEDDILFDMIQKSGDWVGVTFKENKHGHYKSRKLDSMFDEKIDLIKFDVEGFELKALKGAKKIISKWHPVLCIELHLGKGRYTKKDLEDFLKKFDYTTTKDEYDSRFWVCH